jgi:hypothetical protein
MRSERSVPIESAAPEPPPQRVRNRRFAVAAAVSLAALLALDTYLHAGGGFMRAFGRGSQEGQISSKVERAAQMAPVADVIMFGSSFVRSNLSSEPFLRRGLLPWNFGVSGGGPLTSYFALKRIAPVLIGRATKPVLLLELKEEGLIRRRDTLWSEYPQYAGIVRSRLEALREAPLLVPHFRAHGMTSQFISSLVLPSGIYRGHNVQLAMNPRALDTHFFGVEDFGGFAPVYALPAPGAIQAAPAPVPPIADGEWQPHKVAFVRAFLLLARRIGARVVLFEAPTTLLGADSGRYDGLVRRLEQEFGPMRILRTRELALTPDDFGDGHLSIRGADRVTDVLLDWLDLPANGTLAHGITAAFKQYAVPPLDRWEPVAARVAVAGDGHALVRSESAEGGAIWARSPAITVTPGQEAVLEWHVRLRSGTLAVHIIDGDDAHARVVAATPPNGPRFPEFRFFVRVVPTTSRVRIELVDPSESYGSAPAVGEVRLLRFWAHRPLIGGDLGRRKPDA